MLKRHQDLIENLVEEAAYNGLASINKVLLAKCYDYQKFTVTHRKDLSERFAALWEEGEAPKLRFLEANNTITLISCEFLLEEDS